MTTVDQSLLEIKKILSGLSNELTTVKVKMDDAEESSISRFDAVKSEIDDVKTEMLEAEQRSKARSDAVRDLLMDIEKSTASKLDAVKSEIDAVKSEIGENQVCFKDEFSNLERNAIIRLDEMSKMIVSTPESIGVLKGKMNSTNKEMSSLESDPSSTENFDSSKSEFECLKTFESFVGGVSIEISSLKGQVSQVEEIVTSVTESLPRESSSLKPDISEAKDEITKEIVTVAPSNITAMEEQKASTLSGVERAGEFIDNWFKDSDVISLFKQTIGQLSRTRRHLLAQPTMNRMQLVMKFPDDFKNVCVKSLVSKTVIHGNDSSKLSIVRSKYERLYSKGPLVSILMKFLLFHPKVRVHVDFGSVGIERMKGEIIDFDGNKLEGIYLCTFPVLEEQTVYLGGDFDEDDFIAYLARSLCTMCLHLLYDNGGLPFRKDGDPLTEKNWDKMLQEARGKEGRGEILADNSDALYMKTKKGKLIELISRVLYYIAYFETSYGIEQVRQSLPSIFDLYQQQVVPDLTKDWESKMAA